MPQRKTLFFGASCLVEGYFSLHGNVLEHCTIDSCFLRLAAYYWLIRSILLYMRDGEESLITIPLSATSAKVQDFCELCVERGCFEASACVSQII